MNRSTTGSDDLRGLALRTLFPGFAGTEAPPRELRRLLDDGLGGVVLFGRNVDSSRGDHGIAALTARLRAGRPDLLVAIDEEGGDVTRLDVATGSEFPGNAALGAVDDALLTSEVAAALATRLRSCGVDINFAPVADIDVDPRNPIVGVRAFGADPGVVARHVAAFVDGHQRGGVAATVKHFPGHGGTAEDSHVTVPVVRASKRVLAERELVPFRAAVGAGVRLVMTAHIVVPALDPDRMATVSPTIIGLLRDELGYGGVVMTDGLDMQAVSGTIGHAEGAVQALVAGADAICVGGDSTDPDLVEAIAAEIVSAVRTGRLPVSRLAEAARRVRELAAWAASMRMPGYPVSGNAALTLADGNGAVSLADGNGAEPAAIRAARRALVIRGLSSIDGPPLVVQLHDQPSLAAGVVPWGVGAPLRERIPGTVVVDVTEHTASPAAVLEAHPERSVVVSVRGLRRRPWQLAAVAEIRRVRPDAIVVDHELSDPDSYGPPYVLARGASRVAAEAAAEALQAAMPGHPAVDRPVG